MRRALAGLTGITWLLLVFAGTAYAEPAEAFAEQFTPAALTPAEVARVKQLLEEDKRLVRSSPGVELYGYLKFDMAYDTQATNEGNFARWVDSESLRQDDDQFSATPRETRVGLRFQGPDLCAAETSALLEVDFYGGGTENNTQLKMRHAYVKVFWPGCKLTLLAGQTWDVHHPQNMPTINYTVGWWCGNVGFRRPQLRVSKGFVFGACTTGLLEVAAARTITGRNTPFTPTFEDTGEDAGFPTLEARVSVTNERTKGRKLTLGASGHYGHEEHDLDASGASRNFETWSFGVDVVIPLGSAFTVKGELWHGRNMDAYLGGIAQGMNLAVAGAEREIDATGGWLAVQHPVSSCVTLAAGGGIDDPDDADLGPGMRSRNAFGFVNGWYRPVKRLGFGLELSYWVTTYVGQSQGDSIRAQFAVKYDF